MIEIGSRIFVMRQMCIASLIIVAGLGQAGCVPVSTVTCGEDVTAQEKKDAGELVQNFERQKYGLQSAEASLVTYELANILRCGQTLVLVYTPKAGVFGSEHRFDIDLESRKVTEAVTGD